EFGEHSRCWSYRFGPHQAVASVDYLFSDWHDLTNCYQGGGWALHRRTIEDEPGAFATGDFTKGTAEHGTLYFSAIDSRGLILAPGESRRWYDRLAVWREPTWNSLWERFQKRGRLYQVQLYIQSGRPLTALEREQARAFFLEVRKRAMKGAGH